jgi:hypothetical protein
MPGGDKNKPFIWAGELVSPLVKFYLKQQGVPHEKASEAGFRLFM